MTETLTATQLKRPAGVWVVLLWKLWAVVASLQTLQLVNSDYARTHEALRNATTHFSYWKWSVGFVSAILGLAGAWALFRQRKVGIYILTGVFALGVASFAIGSHFHAPGGVAPAWWLFFIVVGFGAETIVVAYAWDLKRRWAMQ